MNGDRNARRDAASMMMSMSHLMDAATVHAQQHQQQLTNSASATTATTAGNNDGGLPATQSMMDSIHAQVHSHHNHTNRGPHKKRTASNADLDESHSAARSGVARTHHLINGGGVLRIPLTGTTAASAVSSAASSIVSSTTTNGGKGKSTSVSASSDSGTLHSNISTINGPVTEEDKKSERRAANRRSAFQSRQRRKILIEDLQRTVAALSKDNNDFRKNNDEIRSQLEAALLENRQLRQITSSLSAQAHAQQAQVAAQQAQQQHQQQTAPVSQQQATASPIISAQQAPPPVPSVSQQQQPQAVTVTPAAPPPFPPQSLSSSTAALTNFLTNFSSQAAGAAPSSGQQQQQHIFNAKIALMAAQSRVSELEHHQAAQAQAAANAAVAQQQQHQAQLQAQAQAAASAALGLAHVQASGPGNNALSDAQHLARLQELLTRGISNASAAAETPPPVAPSVAATNSGAPTSNTSISAAGVDLSHLRSLLEAQQQQQQQQQHQGVGVVQVPGPIPTAPESPGRPSVQEQVAGSPVAIKLEPITTTGGASCATSETVSNAGSAATASIAPQPSSSTSPATNTASLTSAVRPANLSPTADQDAPGIQLLIESLRAGQGGASGNGSAPPLDEAVRNYIQQQQMAQQQAHQTSNAAAAIKNNLN